MIIGISGRSQSGKDTVGKIIQYLTCESKISNSNIYPATFEQFCKEEYNKLFGYCEWQIVKFADPIKDIVCILTGCTREQLEDINFKNSKLPDEWIRYGYADGFFKYYKNGKEETKMNNVQCNKERYELEYRTNFQTAYKVHPTYRELLQYIGTDLFRNQLHEDTWVNAIMSKYRTYSISGGFIDFIKKGEFEETYRVEASKWIMTDVRFPNETKAIKDRGGITIRVNREDITGQGKLNPHTSETALDDYPFDYVIDNTGTIEELIHKVKVILIPLGYV